MRRRLVAIAIVALAPVVAMLAYNEIGIRQQRNEEVRASAAQAARQASSEIERIVEGVHSLLIAVAAIPSVSDLRPNECSDALRSVASNVANIQTIFVLDRTGHFVCGSMDRPTTTDFSDRDYFKSAINDFVVGTDTLSRMSNSPVLPVAIPLVKDGRRVGVVATGLRLEWLQSRIEDRGVASGNAVTIADANGTILARVPLPESFVGTVIPPAYQGLIHAPEPGVIDVMSQDGTERILGYQPIALPRNPLYVSVGISKTEAFSPINRATLINVLSIAGGALLSFLAAMLIGRRFILAPISRIAQTMEDWRAGKTAARTGMVAQRDELSQVGESLDRLLDELECRRERTEKAEEERALLARELAHRVKNSFALLQAFARRSFAKVAPGAFLAFAQRMAALADGYDLLLSGDARSATVRETLLTALRPHRDESGGERVTLEGPGVILPADLTLALSLVIHELLTNAVKYGALGSAEGHVDVKWQLDSGRMLLQWREVGGPDIGVHHEKGFGSVLIERAFPGYAQALPRFEFRRTGLEFELSFNIDDDAVGIRSASAAGLPTATGSPGNSGLSRSSADA